MSLQGNIIISQRKEQAGAPFAAGSANSGLTVNPVTGKIILGDSTGSAAANLLADTFVPLSGFNLSFPGLNLDIIFNDTTNDVLVSNTFGALSYNSTNTTVSLRNKFGATGLLMDTLDNTRLGDVFNLATGFELLIDAALGRASFRDNGTLDRFLVVDPFLQEYILGDTDGALNGSELHIEDNIPRCILRAGGNGASAPELILDATSNSYELLNAASLKRFLSFLPTAGTYKIGDIDTQTNGTSINIADAAQDITFKAVNGIKTNSPGGGVGAWLLGKITAGAVAVDLANYVEIKIDGTVVKLLKAA